MTQKEELVTLSSFESGFQANLFKAKLADEGIESYVFDENVITLNPFYNLALGGIRVKVKNTDLQRAQVILNSVNNQPQTNFEGEIIKCPNCNSSKIKSNLLAIRSVRSFFAFIFSIITFTWPLYYDRLYYCLDCKKDFKINKNVT